MEGLVEKIRKQREERLHFEDGTAVVLRRPTALWLSLWKRRGADEEEMLRSTIVGWVNVKESNLLHGGGDDLVEFDLAACVEWLSDDNAKVNAIGDKLQQMVSAYNAEVTRQEKN